MKPAQKKAAEIVSRIMHTLKIKAGEREKDLAAWIRRQLQSSGARPAFATIIASGKRSIEPHARPTGKKIRKGEQVVVDFGALYQGQRSDMTRTFFVGKPTRRQKQVYTMLKSAQKQAINMIKAGVACREVDLSARQYVQKRCALLCHLTKRGCPGDCFIHTTGHGIGRKVHQFPRISLKNHYRLKAGEVITVEPGVYVKGWGGMRIEDMVLVTNSGHRVLTR
jgi:Xaa-Pro aminopeptidase